jgi:RIO kinase 1
MDGVFDTPTLMTINDMIDDGIITTVNSHFASGKESKVYLASSADNSWVALKVYLTVSAEFKRRMQYIAGDPRFQHVKKGSTRNMISVWARKEFHNMKAAVDAGVSVPEPIAVKHNVLAMRFVGDSGGNASPRLADAEVTLSDYDALVRQMTILYRKAELVHADLSEYNVFRPRKGKTVLFDFGSAVSIQHPLSKQFLVRDVMNVNRFFEKRNVSILDESTLVTRITGANQE